MCSFVIVFLAVAGLATAQTRILNLKQGDICSTIDGARGTCTLLNSCRDPGDFRKEQPPICSFKGREPIICCPRPISSRQSPGLKATQFCEILESNCTHRWDRYFEESKNEITRHVLNGNLAKARDHVHMVLIGYGEQSSIQWGCGGSLISARYVLSAAHCSQILTGPAKWARLGDLDISTTKDDARTQDREIAERLSHPNYKEPQVYNDIALFRLDRDVEFTPWVAPVCLHTQTEMPSNFATVTGWGRIAFDRETSEQLLEADLDVYNDTECRRLLPFEDNKTPRAIDSNLMFCAGKSDGSKDACSGDSGGPLVVKIGTQCLRTQIGITSYGNMCGLPDSPGVYTRVSRYISWIEEIVFPDL